MKLNYPEVVRPLELEELADLIPLHISTQSYSVLKV